MHIPRQLHEDERGLEGIEYLLIAALVAIACIGAWQYLGKRVSSDVRDVASTVDTTVAESASTTPATPPAPPPTPPTPTPPTPPTPTPLPPTPPTPPLPSPFQGANMTGTMFGYTLSSGNFQQNGNVVTGSMIITGSWGSVRQFFTGTATGNTVALQGRVEPINLRPGVVYHPDNLTLTRQADGSWVGNATCTVTHRSSIVSMAGP